MDSGSIATTSRDLKRQKSSEGEDIISNLPESLISQILSSLPIRDAVRTSVLSKTWIRHWTHVTKLEFIDKVFKKEQQFVDFVNKALILTSNSYVESFHLILINIYDPSHVNSWISGIILRRDVKKLNIRWLLKFEFSVVSSHLLFNHCDLEELGLNMGRCAIRVPKSHIYFRNLKHLALTGITFTLDFHSGSKHVILDLPVLKQFKTKDCSWLSVKCVTFTVPLLERLFIEYCLIRQHCAINICASRMTEFKFVGRTSQCILLANSSSANGVDANITLYKCKEATMPEAMVGAFKFLTQFSQAKSLKLNAAELLAKSNGFLADLPPFIMLSHLELEYPIDCEVLFCLLHKSPFLKTLDIQKLSGFDREILVIADVPDCLLSTLEVVEIRTFCGSKHELCLAKFFLKNGLVLKRMSFSFFTWLIRWEDIQKCEEKLNSFKKGCSSTILDFSFY